MSEESGGYGVNQSVDTSSTNAPSIADLEKRIKKLEGGGKDIWDILSILGSLLIPVAIAFTGILFTQQQERNKQSLEKDQQRLAENELRIEQSQALLNLIEPLSDSEPMKRELAAVATSIAIYDKEEAKRILEIVQKRDESPEVQETAASEIETITTAQGNEEAGFQALLAGDLMKARQYFESAYELLPILHNVDEIYNRLLTISQIERYENASNSEQQKILQDIYRQILDQYSWGMPNDVKQEMRRRLAEGS